MDRPNRYLEIPPGPDPSLNKPIDLSVPQREVSPVVREALEQARARIESATAQAKQQILTTTAEAVKRIESSQSAPVARPKEAEPRPLEPREPRQEQPLWKRAMGGIVNILDAPGRVLTQTAIGIADVAKQTWERGHPIEKAVGVPVLVAGSFIIGAAGGVASLISPKAWHETAVALAKPRETVAGLRETISENPLRAAAITGALVAPVKLPKLAGVGVVERVKLVPEKMRVAVVSEAGALAKVEATWPARTWRAIEAEAELTRRGLARVVRAEPEQLVQLERGASKAPEYIMREVSQRVHTRFEQAELPTKYEVAVKDPDRLFKNYEAFVEVTGKTEVLGRRIGRIPESMSFEVKGEGWARALKEKFDWGTYERRVYAKDVEPLGFKKKEFETFERLVVKGDSFEYRARVVDPEVVLDRALPRTRDPFELARLRQAEELLKTRGVEVVRPIPGPPGVAALAHVLKLPRAEELLEMTKISRPAHIEAPKLREPPVRTAAAAVKHLAEADVRLDVRPPVATTLPVHHPGLPRGLEVVHGVRPAPAVDVLGMEGLATDTVSSVGLPRFPEATPLGGLRVATWGESENPRKAGQGVLEGVVLPRVELGDVVETKPRLGQPSDLKQLATGAELPGVGLLRQPIVHAVKPKVVGAQALWSGLRTPERLDLGVRAFEALELDVKQATPPELAEPGIPALPPTTRAQARARRLDKQELRLPGLTTDLRKLNLYRWEWELPEWGRGLRKLLGL